MVDRKGVEMPARKYPWEEWFGGGPVVLEYGTHYHCSQSTMVQSVRNAASARALRVRVVDLGNSIAVETIGDIHNTNRVAIAE
jgi:hypothetical protein